MKFNARINCMAIYLGVFSFLAFIYPIFFTDLHFIEHRYDMSIPNQIVSPIGSTFFHIADLILSLFPQDIMLRSTIEAFTTMSVGVICAVSILGLIKKQNLARTIILVLMSVQFVFDIVVSVLSKNPAYALLSIPPGMIMYYLLRSNVKEQFKSQTRMNAGWKKISLLLASVCGFNMLVLVVLFISYNYVTDVSILYGDTSQAKFEQAVNMDSIYKSKLVQNVLYNVTNFDTNHCHGTDEGYHRCESTQLIKVYQIDQVVNNLSMQSAFTEDKWGLYTGAQYHVLLQQNGTYYSIFITTPDFWNYVISELIISFAGTLLITMAWRRTITK